MGFSDNLKSIRKRARLSQKKLSELSGVSQQAISLIEKGERSPSESTMKMLADAMGCSIADLLCEQTTPETETSPVDGLTSEESSLISMFRELNEEGKRKLIDYADDLSQSGKYIKNSSSRLGKARAQ